jgi:hypothetical protein
MREFPGERQRSAEVQRNLAPAFDLAEAVFNFWLIQEKDKWIAKSTLPPLGIHLAMMLDVQACRLFRSIIEESRRCEGFNARILSRSLFETVLGVGFLLMKRVRIAVDPTGPSGTPGAQKFVAKASSKRVKPGRKHELSREFRAKLYYTHSLIQLERGIERVGKFPGNKQRVKRLVKSLDPCLITNHEKEIGPQWSYILRHRPHTYSGLSVEDLAKVLHNSLTRWYEVIYHFQSRAVHANDPLKHIDVSDGNTAKALFLSSDSQVYENLRIATTLFLVHIRLLHENIGFGPDTEIAYDSLKRKFDRLSWTEGRLTDGT